MKNRTLAPLLVLIALLVTAAPALAGQGYENVTRTFGEPCSNPCGPGQFKEPTTIAVNDETGDVYVLDSGNDRIEWFSEEGKKFGGQFNGSGEYEVGVKKETGTKAGFGGRAGEIETGKFFEPSNIAVDNDLSSESYGDVYVADSGHDVIDKFSATGEYKGQLTGFEPALLNVAVDTSGNVWVDDAYEYRTGVGGNQVGSHIYEFSDAGSLENKVEVVEPAVVPGGLTVDSSDNIFLIADTGARVNEYPSATRERAIIQQGLPLLRTLAIISSTGDLLVDEGSTIDLYKSPVTEDEQPLLTFPSTGLSESAGIAVNGAKDEGTIYATQRGDDDVDVFEPGPAKAPVVVSESASSVEPGAAKFAAVIDPENGQTTYSFEYSTEVKTNAKGEPVLNGNGELELKGEIGTVAGEMELPAEFGDQTAGSQVVEELSASRTVYYRVVAENEEGKGKPAYGKVEAYTKLPLIGSEQFSGLTSTSAKLEATLNPVFEGTDYTFEYATGKEDKDGKEVLEKGEGTLVGAGAVGSEFNEPRPIGTEISGLQPGRTYFYRVVAENFVSQHKANANEGKPVDGLIEEVTPYAAPGVVTGEAQDITATAATLSGEANPEGTAATYHFAYISEAGYEKALENGAANPASPNYQEALAKGAASPYAEGETTETSALPVGDQSVAIGPILANGLLPGVIYHYALVATNKYAIRTIGSDHTFTTQAPSPPAVSTGAASNVSQNAATLSGSVTTNGLQTNYGFEIGTAPGNYGPATGLGAIGGAATEEVHVTLGELAPGTTYYYRITATNADGTVQGQPASFTTPGFPTLLTAPMSTPLIATPDIAFPVEEMASGTGTTGATSRGKLAKALQVCRKVRSKRKRTKCEKQAKAKHGATKKKK